MSNEIVDRALALAEKHPGWASLQVLDTAMEGHVATHPDFEVPMQAGGFCDWLEPPSPFANLLKNAFGTHLEPDDFSCQAERWQEVIDAFRDRYHLWQ